MIRRLFATCTVFLLVASTSHFALAQGMGGSSAFRGGGSGSSGFGSSGLGSSGFGSSGFGSSGMGMGGSGSSGFGSGLGSSTLGSAGFSSSRFGSSGFGSAGFGGSGYGSSSGQQAGGASFVGRDAGDMQNAFGQTSPAANQFFKQMNHNMRQNSSHKQTNKTVQNAAQPMRVDVHVAFIPPQQSSNQLAESIRTRLSKILVDHKMSPAAFTMEGDTAVIRGVAASENERDVIAQLIALQPGVGEVRNEMTVAAMPNAPAVPATPGS